jgi:predicted small secreted protein
MYQVIILCRRSVFGDSGLFYANNKRLTLLWNKGYPLLIFLPERQAVIYKEIKMTNKKLLSGISGILLVFSFVLTGCNKGGGGGDSVWLADLQNPFVGHWESEIPSMSNAKMVSEYKNDGTFTCGFPDMPGFEGPFEGGYSVTGDILIGWLDFEGASAYKFKVVDNNTIDVTEIYEMSLRGASPAVS